MEMEGGCLCGDVRYVIDDQPINSGICHCRTCQRAASAPRLPFLGVPSGAFRLLKGTPTGYTSSPGVTRSFCGRCGSPLTYRRDDAPDELDVMTLSLDDPAAAPPSFHVWTSQAVAWDRPAKNLPAHARSRQE